MHHNARQIQFFMSTDSECPYLEGQAERKLFTSLPEAGANASQNALTQIGFRRSQSILYRPVCQNCSACLSARVPVEKFERSKNQKRIMAKNREVARDTRRAQATDEQYDLFQRYVKTRHKDGGMADMSLHDYAAMVDETNVPSRLIEYRVLRTGRPAELIGVSLTDVLDDGISMVYSFFDPDYQSRSFGTYMILDHIELTKRANLQNVYLGYWVKNSPSMGYKARFSPLELFVGGKWQSFKDPNEVNPEIATGQEVLFKALNAISRAQKANN